VVRHQLRAGLDRVGEAAFEQFGDLAVILLAGAPQQRLVGRVLDQRMLEHVARTRRPPALVEQLGLDQAAEHVAQARLVEGGDRPQHFIGEIAAQDGAQLRHLAQRLRTISSRRSSSRPSSPRPKVSLIRR